MRIQYTFRYANNSNDNNETIEWYVGLITKVSNNSNLKNLGKFLKFYREDSTMKVQWGTNVSKGKDKSYSIVKI